MQLRIDKWLWAVRIFKTRSMATNACKKGRVFIDGITIKPSRIIKTGDIIEVKKPPIIRTYKVKGLLNRPIGVDEKGKKITVASDMEYIRVLEELSAYTTKKKNYFDSVSCLKILAYWIDADETKQVKGELSEEEKHEMKASFSKALGKRMPKARKFY